ncbi:unnamed protein product [Bursaphelenchus okinawaensis]|uniref:Uncharacterized protein n=1 Tax=Bursaphelenchus okinawaensis TaxID=465554 RepID=A0A811KJY8_9BILA|nr:unnamed protein product [Bursaphelenchus okinawaensis]CAG9105255.1 unnamed protein product [Bursaphelenchus okinawaensis]
MSFFDRQPALFDSKKRLGNTGSSSGLNGNGNGAPSISSVFGPPLQQQGSNDEIDSQAESWVELAPSRASMCSSVEAIMVDRDGAEQSGAKLSRASPVSFQSPHVEFETNLEQVKNKLVKDMLPPGKNTDWIWDWSSRPETLFAQRNIRNRGNGESTLTTPPNSPEPSEYDFNGKKPWSLWRFEVIFGLVVSNLMTFVLGATVGFCICKKLAKTRDSFY